MADGPDYLAGDIGWSWALPLAGSVRQSGEGAAVGALGFQLGFGALGAGALGPLSVKLV